MNTTNRDFKGVWIPKHIWLDPDLSIIEKALLVEIDSLDNDPQRGCFASNEYLAKFLKKDEGTVANMISSLRKRNYLETCFWDGRNRGLRLVKRESSLHENVKAAFTDSLDQPSRKRESSLHENVNILIQDINTGINTVEEEEGGLKNPRLIDEAVEIVEFFNSSAGRKVSTAVKGRGCENVGWVAQLLRKGYTREEIETMIIFKVWEWRGNPKMEKHLEPITIFKRHGATYIQQAIEARDNPEFLKVLQRSREAEQKQPGKIPGDGSITRGVAERLLNW